MKVHFWMGPAHIIPGGHRVQLTKTAEALSRLGVEIQTGPDPFASRPLPDIVHSYGATPNDVRGWRNSGLRTAVSTIYWDQAYRHGLSGPGGRMGTAAVQLRLSAAVARSAQKGQLFRKCHDLLAEDLRLLQVYESADIILPNAPLEARAIRNDLGVTTPAWLVPNGADHQLFQQSSDNSRPIDVLFAGRFEPHKNQLGLVDALRTTGLRVVLVGQGHPHHPEYSDRCRDLARGSDIEIRPAVPLEELVELYAAAKVHVLPSWFESTGLVSLEAALAGCRIVTTNRGYAQDYFEDLAWFCDPADRASIRHAVQAALTAESHPPLHQHVRNNFTWDHTARATLNAYEALLDGRHARAPQDWPSVTWTTGGPDMTLA